METQEGGNLSTPNQVFSQALIEENKSHKKNQNVSTHKKAFNTLKEDKHIYCFNSAHFFSLQFYFMVCYYHHQEERVSVTQGIKLIIGLIRGICILMRHGCVAITS